MIIKELSRFILIINKFIYYEQIQIDIYGLKINWVLKIFYASLLPKSGLPSRNRKDPEKCGVPSCSKNDIPKSAEIPAVLS